MLKLVEYRHEIDHTGDSGRDLIVRFETREEAKQFLLHILRRPTPQLVSRANRMMKKVLGGSEERLTGASIVVLPSKGRDRIDLCGSVNRIRGYD
jgi:hypothetical protein